jgi:hypothetical protein
VERGIFERRTYREAGSRPRDEYVLTEAGRSLSLVIGALSVWARTYRPREDSTSPRFSVPESGSVAHLAFVTADGTEVEPVQLVAARAPDHL